MRRVVLIPSLVTAGLVLYGAVGAAGLAVGLSARAARPAMEAAPSPLNDVVAPNSVIASRFVLSASFDGEQAPAESGSSKPAQIAALKRAFARAAMSAALHTGGAQSALLQSALLQSVALQYGVLLDGPSQVAAANSDDLMSAALQAAVERPDSTAPWQERFFLASVMPAAEAAAFRLSSSEGAGAAQEPAGNQPRSVAPDAPAKFQIASAAAAPRRRPAGRPGSVLNDAQIASIKSRLNLTPDQERMWPAVEAALRDVSYTKAAQAPNRSAQDGGRMAYIDPNGSEVEKLKQAALPLIMRLNDDQKREVRSLAHVMGLDEVASSF